MAVTIGLANGYSVEIEGCGPIYTTLIVLLVHTVVLTSNIGSFVILEIIISV